MIKQMQQLVHNKCQHPVPNKIPNHDLLDQIRLSVWEAKNNFQGIHKVVSHQNHDLLSKEETWICRGNDAADAIAGRAFEEYPELMNLQQQLKAEISELCNMRFWVHRILIKTGQLAMDKIREKKRNDENDDHEQVNALPRRAVTFQQWIFPDVLPDSLHKYNIPEWPIIAGWIRTLHEGTERMHLSWYQFVCGFSLAMAYDGPMV